MVYICLLVKLKATIVAFFALSGFPAPSMLPTLTATAIPIPNGTYNGIAFFLHQDTTITTNPDVTRLRVIL